MVGKLLLFVGRIRQQNGELKVLFIGSFVRFVLSLRLFLAGSEMISCCTPLVFHEAKHKVVYDELIVFSSPDG